MGLEWKWEESVMNVFLRVTFKLWWLDFADTWNRINGFKCYAASKGYAVKLFQTNREIVDWIREELEEHSF